MEVNDAIPNLGDRPSSIDNSDIEGEFQNTLKQKLQVNHDYVLIPKKAWDKLFSWYGGGPVFKRKILQSSKKRKLVELYPPLLWGFSSMTNGEIDYKNKQSIII